MKTKQSSIAKMLKVQQLSHGYILKSSDVVEVNVDQLARMSHLITVECHIGHQLLREQLVGYREADTGCVMVSYDQFSLYFL